MLPLPDIKNVSESLFKKLLEIFLWICYSGNRKREAIGAATLDS